jgi:hypothetical protein
MFACIYGGNAYASINSGTNWSLIRTTENWNIVSCSRNSTNVKLYIANGFATYALYRGD